MRLGLSAKVLETWVGSSNVAAFAAHRRSCRRNPSMRIPFGFSATINPASYRAVPPLGSSVYSEVVFA
jgi:hypothetical protein